MQITYNLSAIDHAVASFWEVAQQHRVFAFYADMGAGKTTFIAALCQLLGATTKPSSPTFSLINQYHYFDKKNEEAIIFHADWYRLESVEDAIDAGMEEMLLQPDALCFIEWPQRAEALLPKETLKVDIHIIDEQNRTLSLRNTSYSE